MALTTYAQLQTSIKNWLKWNAGEDIDDETKDFIALAEARIKGDSRVRIRQMETDADLTTTGGVETVALPTRFLGFKWLYVDGDPKSILDIVSGQTLYSTYSGSTSGLPKVALVEGSVLRFGPTPDTDYTVKTSYYQAFEPLSDSVTTNDLLTEYPNIYLFASLVEAAFFTKNAEAATLWNQRYEEAIGLLEQANDNDKWSGSSLTSFAETTPD